VRILRDCFARPLGLPDFPGLNLTKEVLEGQTARLSPKLQWGDAQNTLPETGKDYATADESLRPLLEVQVVEAADSVAYDTHDADDALELELLTLDELLGTALWAEAARRVRRRYAAIEGVELRRAVLHELIDWQVSDLLARARVRLADGSVTTPSDARRAEYLISASPELAEQKEQLEAFLHERVYRHPNVLAHRRQAQDLLLEMFDGFVRRPELLPDRFLARSRNVGLRRSIGDYLAGMTDRFAQRERDRLLSASIRG
jgi:dGTPase